MQSELEQLREIALRFKVEPLETVGHAARLDTVLHTLGNINNSYRAFIKAEFLKRPDFQKEFQRSPKVLEAMMEKLQLLVVDVEFSSFAPALAPDITQTQSSIFAKDVLAWQREEFANFKNNVVAADFNDADYLKEVTEMYSELERHAIFQPLFSAAGNGTRYKVKLLNGNNKETRTLRPPVQEAQHYYKAARQPSQVNTLQTVQFYAKVKKTDGQQSFKKADIRDVLYWEALDHETYPFKTTFIQFGDIGYVLKERLNSDVSYEDGQYFIANELLDITVWGDTRDDAEEAFSFSFHSLYKNYAEEVDELLTSQALQLKNTLLNLVANKIGKA